MNCEMCGTDNEIYLEAFYKEHSQKICYKCFDECIPRYTKVIGEKKHG